MSVKAKIPLEMSVKAFLEKLRPVSAKSVFRFVTGNQSADMDSVVSAISYAYFYNQKNPSEQPYLPLVNITRDELRLRRDIVLLLQSHSISKDQLFFLDDVHELTKSAQSKLEIVLVDHCGLQGELLNALYDTQRLSVAAIIDHHADEGVFTNASPRIIHSNGSCSALVFNYWNRELGGIQDTEIVLMLLGPLLIDTSNMTQKVEAGDLEAFDHYKAVLLGGPTALQTAAVVNGSTPIEGFYLTLKAAKKNLEGFLFFDILRKDYKQFKFSGKSGESVTIGFSSLGKSMAWILKKFSTSQITETFDQMVQTFHLDVVVITTSYTKKETGEYTREFCYYPTKKSLEGLSNYLDPLQLDKNIYNKKEVEMAVEEISKTRSFHVYNQVNIRASRKQVVPAVKDAIEAKF
ncbi:CIC11C00000004986 [Sungouiella intermedia]|uniref:CIC11C00000004986 n=1 Tax=Sungouiella intermedia TaxID=45354 RepID=A0A1L0C1Q4_9ASCO|nr:CIC11C00000004986 [[Candida] intermedia]